MGGHGTAIAWGATIARDHGFPAALETGIAVATMSLIIASVLGGSIAKYLIERHRLEPAPTDVQDGEVPAQADDAPIDKMGIMRAMLVVNVAVILGYLLHGWITTATGLTLPLFVPCLLVGILLSNTVPRLFPRLAWPARTASLDLILSYALSIFLAMSLMGMQLWTLAGMAGTLLIVVAAQTVVAVAYILFIGFPGPRRMPLSFCLWCRPSSSTSSMSPSYRCFFAFGENDPDAARLSGDGGGNRAVTPPESHVPASAVAFNRLKEAGIISSGPQKVIADGTDWRLLHGLRRELRI